MIADRVKETSATIGTGSYALVGAAAGFRTFVDGLGSGNPCFYVAAAGTDWEIGIGTVTDGAPDTLSRDTIIASSNANAAVDWPAGEKTVFCDSPARNYLPVRHNLSATVPPTAADDASLGYGTGSFWKDTSTNFGYLCIDPDPGFAEWIPLWNLDLVAAESGGIRVGNTTGNTLGNKTTMIGTSASCQVEGPNCAILGGGAARGTVDARASVFSGITPFARHPYSRAHGFPNNGATVASAGNHQHLQVGLVGTTTDATPKELFLPAAGSAPSARLVIPTNCNINFTLRVSAFKSDGSAGASYNFTGSIRRGAGDPVFDGGVPAPTVVGETTAGWDAALSIDTVDDALVVTVTGGVGETIAWTALLDGVMAAASPA